MKRPDFVARQSSNPHGVIGRFIAWIMARETAALNARAVELLALQPSDRVLEIGFGHGRTVASIARIVVSGHVAGVDVSASMTRLATRRNRAAVADGRVDLRTGDCAALPFPAADFDKSLSVHTVYFWTEPGACLREIRRVLRPGGCFVLGFTPKGTARTASFPTSVYTFYEEDEIREMVTAAGFTSVAIVAADAVALARATV